MRKLTKLEKLKYIGLLIEAATGVVGTAVILTEGHPYLTLVILALGAMSSKSVEFLKERERKPNNEGEV